MGNLAYRIIPCTALGFRQELMRQVCMEIGTLEFGEHIGLYVPTSQKTFVYGQGEQSKFATAVRDESLFPESETNFDAHLVHFPAGYGTEACHADPLGVPKLVAQIAREFVASRIRNLQEEPADG